jgi:hypothetical protein
MACHHQGFSGLNGDVVEKDCAAQIGENVLYEVVVSHGDTTAEQKDIPLKSTSYGGSQGIFFIAGGAEGGGFKPDGLHRGEKEGCVGVAQLTGARFNLRRYQFVTSAENSDLWQAVCRNRGMAVGGEEGDCARAEARTGGEKTVAALRYFAAVSNVGVGLGRGLEGYLFYTAVGVFDRYNAICSGWYDRSGHDLGSGAGREMEVQGRARCGDRHHRKACSGRRFTSDGVAVHGRDVCRWHVDGGGDIRCQHTTEGSLSGCWFGGQGF